MLSCPGRVLGENWFSVWYFFLFSLSKANVIALYSFVTGKKGNVLHKTRIYY